MAAIKETGAKKTVGFDAGANSWQVIEDGRFCPVGLEKKFEEVGMEKGNTYAIYSDGDVYLLPDGRAGRTEVKIGSIA